MTPEETLALLKYAGFALAGITAVWGLLTRPSVEVDGKKRLTRAGQIAVMIAVASATVSSLAFGFEAIVKRQGEIAAADQRLADQRAAEAQVEADRRERAAIRRFEQAERRAIAAEQLVATASARDRILVEQSRSTRRSLEGVWRSATRVNPSQINVALVMACGTAGDYSSFFDGATLALKVDGVEYQSGEFVKFPVTAESTPAVLFRNFITYENPGDLISLEGWRDAEVAFEMISNRSIDAARLKALYGELGDEVDPETFGERAPPRGAVPVPGCDVEISLVVEGLMIAKTAADPFLVKSGASATPFLMPTWTYVDKHTLPEFDDGELP